MSIQVVPSFSFQKHPLWYFFFSLIVLLVGLVLVVYNVLLCLLWFFFVFSYFLIHYIQSLPLEAVLYPDKLSVGSLVLGYDDIKSYRLITRVIKGVPCLYGICIECKTNILYYYAFREHEASIKKRIVLLDQYVPRSISSSSSLYEEILSLTKI